MRVLILGGTTEATALARALAGRKDLDAILSLAGRTSAPAESALPMRVGGFGGIEGLAAYLTSETIDVVLDATHPFAAQMSRHAAAACAQVGAPLLVYTRPAWEPLKDDRWTTVATMDDAVAALGPQPRTVFLTVGRLSLPAFKAAPQHTYVVRSIDEPDRSDLPPRHELVLARGPFDVAAETALIQRFSVDVVVTKNSGGKATAAKLEAARTLGLPVIMVDRPPPSGPRVEHRLAAVLDWIEAHRPPP
ncbi:precorrin-6A reductase [Alsobacter metallidurans]|uniref:Precorrin-6A reductase n=1 Tax=Alsobacter metallidurans TaxID=340221 RepID=A0A917I3H7_9HYPH|nr:cobalt-precorrin-6A reductase [Alsobacter metallidurans]GGH10532.1 precorrin-6A reductase [Alsobacter metallidurans]